MFEILNIKLGLFLYFLSLRVPLYYTGWHIGYKRGYKNLNYKDPMLDCDCQEDYSERSPKCRVIALQKLSPIVVNFVKILAIGGLTLKDFTSEVQYCDVNWYADDSKYLHDKYPVANSTGAECYPSAVVPDHLSHLNFNLQHVG
jgi:hypothetical protein